MKQWDIQTIINMSKAEQARGTGVKPCSRFAAETFDFLQMGLLSEADGEALRVHANDCQACKAYLKHASLLWKQSGRMADTVADAPILEKLAAHMDLEDAAKQRLHRWAASKSDAVAFKGTACGVVIAEEHDFGKVIRCVAYVRAEERPAGAIFIRGLHEGYGILPALADKFSKIIFPNCAELIAYNMDRRVISVDLQENLFSEADSLCLAILMAIINAIHQRTEDPPYAFVADVEGLGKLGPVSKIPQKIEAALQGGIRHFILCKENQNDIPQRYLNDPDLTFHCYATLKEILNHFNLNLPEFEVQSVQRVDGQYPAISAVELPDGNLNAIYERLAIDPVQYAPLNYLVRFFEDLCHTGNFQNALSTAFLIGPIEQVERVLPDRIFAFKNPTKLFELSNTMEQLAALVNGHQLCFVLDAEGTIDAIRRIDTPLSAGPWDMLPSTGQRLAYLSRACDGMIFYFPPFLNQIELFAAGEITARFTNGKWKMVVYGQLFAALKQISAVEGIYWPILKEAARAAILLAEQGVGGTFAFIADPDKLRHLWHSALDEQGLKLDAGAVAIGPNAAMLTNMARMEGAVVLRHEGFLVACNAFFHVDVRIRARHQAARLFSEAADALVVVASRYGEITVFHKGQILARM